LKRFVVPPTWPSPPRRSWVPPKTWRPDPSWPPPPEGWRFWVDGKGKPVRGPVGRYGGPSRTSAYAGIGGLVLLLGVNFWALSAIGLFGGDSGSQAIHVVDDSSPAPSPTVVPPKATRPTSAPPPVQKTTVTPTPKPTPKPTRSRTTERKADEDRAEPEPTPTITPTPSKTVRPPRPSTSTPPSREELIRQYCIQQGYDPEWCDPDNWPQNPADDPRTEEP
jgi:hypothetical protein